MFHVCRAGRAADFTMIRCAKFAPSPGLGVVLHGVVVFGERFGHLFRGLATEHGRPLDGTRLLLRLRALSWFA